MDESRRSFLKVASCSVLGATCLSPVATAFANAIKTETNPKGLKGKRWAMVVDTTKCLSEKGCNKCAQACHLAHNVPQIGNTKEEIKWIWKEKYQHAFPNQYHEYTQEPLKDSPIPVLCNHCENPPCVRVCPPQATFKRADGLVMMDQHRCIGCRYCMAACPYGSRSFNWKDPRAFIKPEIRQEYPTRTKGVVEKCTFCAERLAVGLLPLCVEECAKVTGALSFGDLGDKNSPVSKILEKQHSIRRKPVLGTSPQVYYLV